jgi:hypothetical protein
VVQVTRGALRRSEESQVRIHSVLLPRYCQSNYDTVFKLNTWQDLVLRKGRTRRGLGVSVESEQGSTASAQIIGLLPDASNVVDRNRWIIPTNSCVSQMVIAGTSEQIKLSD